MKIISNELHILYSIMYSNKCLNVLKKITYNNFYGKTRYIMYRRRIHDDKGYLLQKKVFFLWYSIRNYTAAKRYFNHINNTWTR